jgi:hypothetical protein
MLSIYPLYNNAFTLRKPIENCAKTIKEDRPDLVDTHLYKKCFCCGDKYNPHHSLGCPVNPWA